MGKNKAEATAEAGSTGQKEGAQVSVAHKDGGQGVQSEDGNG